MRKIYFIFSLFIVLSLLQTSAAETLVDERISISALGVDGYGFDVNEDNAVITVTLEIWLGNDISFFVADDENTVKALNFESFEYYGARSDIVRGSYDITLGPADEYWVILDNTDSLSGVTVDVEIEIESSSNPLFWIFLIVVLIIGFVWWNNKNNENKQKKQMNQPSQQNQGVVSNFNEMNNKNFCPNCGSEQQNVKFCTKCGQKL